MRMAGWSVKRGRRSWRDFPIRGAPWRLCLKELNGRFNHLVRSAVCGTQFQLARTGSETRARIDLSKTAKRIELKAFVRRVRRQERPRRRADIRRNHGQSLGRSV